MFSYVTRRVLVALALIVVLAWVLVLPLRAQFAASEDVPRYEDSVNPGGSNMK